LQFSSQLVVGRSFRFEGIPGDSRFLVIGREHPQDDVCRILRRFAEDTRIIHVDNPQTKVWLVLLAVNLGGAVILGATAWRAVVTGGRE